VSSVESNAAGGRTAGYRVAGWLAGWSAGWLAEWGASRHVDSFCDMELGVKLIWSISGAMRQG